LKQYFEDRVSNDYQINKLSLYKRKLNDKIAHLGGGKIELQTTPKEEINSKRAC
jgi:hypothetical protein